jgi:hypothetical protein
VHITRPDADIDREVNQLLTTGVVCNSVAADFFSSGITLPKIISERRKEQIGSAIMIPQ